MFWTIVGVFIFIFVGIPLIVSFIGGIMVVIGRVFQFLVMKPFIAYGKWYLKRTSL